MGSCFRDIFVYRNLNQNQTFLYMGEDSRFERCRWCDGVEHGGVGASDGVL